MPLENRAGNCIGTPPHPPSPRPARSPSPPPLPPTPPSPLPCQLKWQGVQLCPGHEGAGRRVWGEGEGFSPQMWEQITTPKCGGRIRPPQARVSIPLLELEKTGCGGRLLTHFPGSEAKKKKDCTEKRKSDVGGNYCFSKCVGKLLHFLGYRYP